MFYYAPSKDTTETRSKIKVSEDDIARVQAGYGVEGVDENEPAVNNNKKRKHEESLDKNAKKSKDAPKEPVNRAIYISNLPLQATEIEIAERFAKYGVLALEPAPDGGERARITMYKDKDGNFKGDALLGDAHAPNHITFTDEA